MSKITEFKITKPVDSTDPGFRLPGNELRWVSAKVSEGNPGRPWTPLRKSDCPAKLVERIETFNPMAFANGDIFRRGDCILTYCPNEVFKPYQRQIRDKAKEQEARISKAPKLQDHKGNQVLHVSENESRDVTQEMIAKFKQQKTEE